MPSYSETWDVTKPAGSRDISLGDDDIREFKRAIDERLNTDHYKPNDETGVTTVGYHRKCTLVVQTSAPASVTDAFIMYCKSDGDSDELYGIDEVGNVIKFTESGKLAVLGSEGWRTGDKILSSNTTTPTGWTDQSSTYDNSFIRISSGTPLTSGGSNTHDHGGATATESAHTHTYTGTTDGAPDTGSRYDGSSSPLSVPGHTHTYSGTTAAGSAHSHVISSANNVPVYIQLKMYSKT